MKPKVLLSITALLAIIICSCEPIVVTPPVVQGLEGVYGTVYTINAEPIEGIMIEVYYDKELTKRYPEDGQEAIYTDTEGYYSLREIARHGVDSLEIYVIASDTTGIYETQMQKGVIILNGGDGSTGISGDTKVDFFLTKIE